MTTVTTKVFKSGNSRAVRLPRLVSYEVGAEVTVTTHGDVVTIRPKRPRISVQEMLRLLKELPSPGDIEVRDSDIFPDRPGL